MRRHYPFKTCHIELVKGDITDMQVDAIVNAANAQLILGAGVAGAIRSKGGPEIQEACDRIGGTHVGGAVITTAGKLPAKFVIHAVGPRMGEGDEDRKLGEAVHNSLVIAGKNNVKSIAFPAISTGIFGFPVQRCAEIMLRETVNFLGKNNSLEQVYFCLWDVQTFQVFADEADRLLLD